MAQPPIYSRKHSFTDELGTQAGINLDDEFNTARATIEATRANIGAIQRDDGKLANASVHADALGATALLLIGSGKFVPRGIWATATLYSVGDIAENSLIGYVCVAQHVAGAVFATDKAAGKWVTIAQPSAANAISFSPSGGLSSLTVQDTLVELDTKKVPFTLLSNRNAVINGNFDVWQRGTSLTSGVNNSTFLSDRWKTLGAGSTVVRSQQPFTLGQTVVPNEPKFFDRSVVTSVANAANYQALSYICEGVRTFAGQTATLSFWAKADAGKNIAIEFIQNFGTGGSPSAAVLGIGVSTKSLTTAFQKFTVAVAVPSIAGKTIGANGDDVLQMVFWFDAGANLSSRTNTLGQQSGTFDIAQVQLEAGSTATQFETLSFGDTLQKCLRYYEKSFPYATAPAQNSSTVDVSYPQIVAASTLQTVAAPVIFKTLKRIVPTITLFNPGAANAQMRNGDTGVDCTATAAYNPSERGFSINATTPAGSAAGQRLNINWTADNEL